MTREEYHFRARSGLIRFPPPAPPPPQPGSTVLGAHTPPPQECLDLTTTYGGEAVLKTVLFYARIPIYYTPARCRVKQKH